MEKKYLLFALCSFMTMSFVSCDNDDDPKPEIPTESSTTGVYFLNAGKLGSNNSTLDYYDPETKNLTTKVFATENGRGVFLARQILFMPYLQACNRLHHH